MGDLLIRNIPEAVKQEIAEAARANGQSLSDKAVDLLQRGLVVEHQEMSQPAGSAWAMLRSVFESEGPPTGQFAEVLDEVESERKRDFGRPLDFANEDGDRG